MTAGTAALIWIGMIVASVVRGGIREMANRPQPPEPERMNFILGASLALIIAAIVT